MREVGGVPRLKARLDYFLFKHRFNGQLHSIYAEAGTLTAAAELTLSELGATGPLSFDANSGRIEHAMLPVGIDYERISADLMLGGGAIVAVHNFDLEGPALSASVTGSVLRGREPGEPQLDLAVEIEIKNPLLRAAVQGVGVRVDGRGRSAFSVRGTPSAPRMR